MHTGVNTGHIRLPKTITQSHSAQWGYEYVSCVLFLATCQNEGEIEDSALCAQPYHSLEDSIYLVRALGKAKNYLWQPLITQNTTQDLRLCRLTLFSKKCRLSRKKAISPLCFPSCTPYHNMKLP